MTPQDQTRLDWIDSLRGIAACLVMLLHFWVPSVRDVPGLSDQPLARGVSFLTTNILDLGKVGVVLFFAISGFVIPPSLLKCGPGRLKKFMLNRFFRLYPLYWLSVVFATFNFLPSPDWGRVLANLSMVQPLLGFHDMLGLYWTLQVELTFYMLCSALFLLHVLGNRRSLISIYCAMLLASIGVAALRYLLQRKLPAAIPLGLSVMLFGSLWYRFLMLREGSHKSMALLFLALVVALVPVSLLAYNENYGFQETWFRYFFSYLLAVTVFVGFTLWNRITLAPIVYLGKVSYSIYLLHATLGLWVLAAIESRLDRPTGAWIAILVAAFVTVAASSLTYFFIEAPFIRIGRRISGSSSSASAAAKSLGS